MGRAHCTHENIQCSPCISQSSLQLVRDHVVHSAVNYKSHANPKPRQLRDGVLSPSLSLRFLHGDLTGHRASVAWLQDGRGSIHPH